jgi:hypothetical protein
MALVIPSRQHHIWLKYCGCNVVSTSSWMPHAWWLLLSCGRTVFAMAAAASCFVPKCPTNIWSVTTIACCEQLVAMAGTASDSTTRASFRTLPQYPMRRPALARRSSWPMREIIIRVRVTIMLDERTRAYRVCASITL